MNYGYQKHVSKRFEVVDAEIRESLQKVGFGVISEIDIKKTFKEKLDVNFKPLILIIIDFFFINS